MDGENHGTPLGFPGRSPGLVNSPGGKRTTTTYTRSFVQRKTSPTRHQVIATWTVGRCWIPGQTRPQTEGVKERFFSEEKSRKTLFGLLMQDGPLPVINGVINPINGLING